MRFLFFFSFFLCDFIDNGIYSPGEIKTCFPLALFRSVKHAHLFIYLQIYPHHPLYVICITQNPAFIFNSSPHLSVFFFVCRWLHIQFSLNFAVQ